MSADTISTCPACGQQNYEFYTDADERNDFATHSPTRMYNGDLVRPCDKCIRAFRMTGDAPHLGTLTLVPVFDQCPDYKPADHVCTAWGDGWYWHRGGEDNTEVRIDLPPGVKPGDTVAIWTAAEQETP